MGKKFRVITALGAGFIQGLLVRMGAHFNPLAKQITPVYTRAVLIWAESATEPGRELQSVHLMFTCHRAVLAFSPGVPVAGYLEPQ